MRVSSRGEYGLRALIELARRYGEGPISCGEIAARQGIPTSYLNQLLILLREGGIVRSVRGPRGGHELTRPPGRITLGEALKALGESTAAANCGKEECDRIEGCGLRSVWAEIEAATEEILRERTLLDLVGGEARGGG